MIKPRPEDTGTLALEKIRIDGGTQMRADLNEAVVAEYAQTIVDGTDFPPVIVFFDGSKCWLADGFHRFFAYRKAGALELPAEIHQGGKRDAILYSVGANAAHGLRRTNADKRKAVETLLADKEWSAWADREIARRAGVGHPLVASIRAELSGRNSRYAPDTQRTVERGGAVYQQNTANIGKGRPTVEAAPAAPIAATAPGIRDAADRAEETAALREQRAEDERRSEAHRAAIPEAIRLAEATRDAAKARRREAADDDGLTDEQRIAELQQAVAVLETENTALKAENAKFEAMRVQWEQGGFEKVIAGRDETIRVQQSNVETESADKAEWVNKAKFWKKEAERLGWKPDVVKIDTKTGALKDG